VYLVVVTALFEKLLATAMASRVSVAVTEIAPLYLVDAVVGVVPLVV
jgi:hypothetical protein